MMIKRSTPDVGYINPDSFKAMNISQVVRAGNTVHLSGVVSATGNGEVVAPGDAAGQISQVLDLIDKFLSSEGMTFANVVAVTVFSPVLEKIYPEIGQFSARFVGHPPCMTMIGVKDLAGPDYLLEVVVVAAD